MMELYTLLILLALFVFPDLYIYLVHYKSRVKNVIGHILFFLPSIILLGGILFFYNRSTHQDLFAHKYLTYFLLASLFFILPKLLLMIFSILDQIIRLLSRKRKFHFFIYMGVLAAIVSIFILIKGTWIDRNKLEVRHITLISDEIPEDFCGFRILQISDLHLGNLVNKNKMVSRLVSTINGENPDLIVITGDLVNQYAKEMDGLESILMEMKADKGIISILGNHDYGDYVEWDSEKEKIENFNLLIKKQQDFGWIVLRNEAEIIHNGNDSIAIIGVENWGEPPFTAYGDLKLASQSVEDVPLKVLLTHNPTHWENEVAGKKDIFLTLSGHTHAMQLIFNISGMSFSPASLRYKHWKGLYTEDDGQHLYVNLGIGYVGIPFRFGARPEISIIEFNRKMKKQPIVTEIADEEAVSNEIQGDTLSIKNTKKQ